MPYTVEELEQLRKLVRLVAAQGEMIRATYALLFEVVDALEDIPGIPAHLFKAAQDMVTAIDAAYLMFRETP